jgi:hypothetical protein
MAIGLSIYAKRFLLDPLPSHTLDAPLLVWEVPASKPDTELLLGTMSGFNADRPRSGEPLVFELRKGTNNANAFAMGITLGRTENNDVVLSDNSVSRFHAYFMKEARTQQWKLVDAESKNGTWLNSLKLDPNKQVAVADNAKLKFGDVELTFLLPDSFLALVKKMSESG